MVMFFGFILFCVRVVLIFLMDNLSIVSLFILGIICNCFFSKLVMFIIVIFGNCLIWCLIIDFENLYKFRKVC